MIWAAFDTIVFLLGFTACWLVKDAIRAKMIGPEQTAVDFRTGLNAILIAARKGRIP